MANNILIEFYEEIIECMVEYGNLEVETARKLLTSSRIYDLNTDPENTILFHEYPYYWAMHLIHYHPDKPLWHQDSNLWPPPKEYMDKINSR